MRTRKKENICRLPTFWFGTFAMLFSATGCVVRHENISAVNSSDLWDFDYEFPS